jgi:hypothetical protein
LQQPLEVTIRAGAFRASTYKASSTPAYIVRGHVQYLGMSANCTQTNYLYADSVCCLSVRMENNEVCRSGRVRVHWYVLQCVSVLLVFESLRCGRTKGLLLL